MEFCKFNIDPAKLGGELVALRTARGESTGRVTLSNLIVLENAISVEELSEGFPSRVFRLIEDPKIQNIRCDVCIYQLKNPKHFSEEIRLTWKRGFEKHVRSVILGNLVPDVSTVLVEISKIPLDYYKSLFEELAPFADRILLDTSNYSEPLKVFEYYSDYSKIREVNYRATRRWRDIIKGLFNTSNIQDLSFEQLDFYYSSDTASCFNDFGRGFVQSIFVAGWLLSQLKLQPESVTRFGEFVDSVQVIAGNVKINLIQNDSTKAELYKVELIAGNKTLRSTKNNEIIIGESIDAGQIKNLISKPVASSQILRELQTIDWDSDYNKNVAGILDFASFLRGGYKVA